MQLYFYSSLFLKYCAYSRDRFKQSEFRCTATRRWPAIFLGVSAFLVYQGVFLILNRRGYLKGFRSTSNNIRLKHGHSPRCKGEQNYGNISKRKCRAIIDGQALLACSAVDPLLFMKVDRIGATWNEPRGERQKVFWSLEQAWCRRCCCTVRLGLVVSKPLTLLRCSMQCWKTLMQAPLLYTRRVAGGSTKGACRGDWDRRRHYERGWKPVFTARPSWRGGNPRIKLGRKEVVLS